MDYNLEQTRTVYQCPCCGLRFKEMKEARECMTAHAWPKAFLEPEVGDYREKYPERMRIRLSDGRVAECRVEEIRDLRSGEEVETAPEPEGFYGIPKILFGEDFKELSSNERLVYTAIRQHAENGDYPQRGAWFRLSQGDLVDELYISRRTVQRSIYCLVGIGLLEEEPGWEKQKWYRLCGIE